MSTAPGDRPPYVRNMEKEIKELKGKVKDLSSILNVIFGERNWLEMSIGEIMDLKKIVKSEILSSKDAT